MGELKTSIFNYGGRRENISIAPTSFFECPRFKKMNLSMLLLHLNDFGFVFVIFKLGVKGFGHS
jgi:hypothetical protein